MTSESNRRGVLGTNYVQRVLTKWGWGFQKIDQENDDGFDAIIYIRSKKLMQTLQMTSANSFGKVLEVCFMSK